jgi:hypothetical protein
MGMPSMACRCSASTYLTFQGGAGLVNVLAFAAIRGMPMYGKVPSMAWQIDVVHNLPYVVMPYDAGCSCGPGDDH